MAERNVDLYADERERIKDAVRHALVDCVTADVQEDTCANSDDMLECYGRVAHDVRAEWAQCPSQVPSKYLARIDPEALAQNVAYRLLGPAPAPIRKVA